MRNNALSQKIGSYFESHPEVQAAFLFGSLAKGKARPDSDADIAILLNESVPARDYLDQRLRLMNDLSDRIGRDADVVILNESGPVLKHQVLAFGRLMFERDHNQTTRFKARAMMEYMDWLPYKERLDRATLQHFKRSAHG